MSLADNISMELDGELVDADPIGITCDFCPGTTVIDPAEPMQFEVIRFDDPAPSRGAFALPQTWTLDAVRCSWHADALLPHATRGVDEALATVVVDAVDEFDYRVRGESLTLVDYSPADQGRDAPILPDRMIEVAAQRGDFGICRRSRAVTYIDALRAAGEEALASELERLLTPGELLDRQEGLVATPPPDALFGR